MDSVFQFLCRQLEAIGKLFGLNYYKVSVYICIHLWPLLCVAMALVLLTMAILSSTLLWIAASSVYALFNIFGYWIVIKHYYPGTIDEIFNRCYLDLIKISEEWHTTYAIVNLIIYVVLFIAIMAFDVILLLLMRS